MSGVALEQQEEEALYVVLKAREEHLVDPLRSLLRRIERSLFDRLTIDELETLPRRYPEAR